MKDFAIEVKPEKRTEEDEQQQKQISSRRNTRNQYILSFSARMFKVGSLKSVLYEIYNVNFTFSLYSFRNFVRLRAETPSFPPMQPWKGFKQW